MNATLTAHQASFRKPLKHISYIGAVDPDLAAETDLVAARRTMQGRQEAVLDRRETEFPALFHENGGINLVEATDQITHPRLQRHLLVPVSIVRSGLLQLRDFAHDVSIKRTGQALNLSS